MKSEYSGSSPFELLDARDLEPIDLYFENEQGVPEAAYKGRYIALPRSTFRRLCPNVDKFGAPNPDFFNPPIFSEEIRQEMRDALENLLGLEKKEDLLNSEDLKSQRYTPTPEQIFVHEHMHHRELAASGYWLYINLCVGVRRLLFTFSLRHKSGLSTELAEGIVEICRDISLIKAQIFDLEENRQCLSEDRTSDTPGDFEKIIMASYRDPRFVKYLIEHRKICPEEYPRERARAIQQISVLKIFLDRHWKTIFKSVPFLLGRFFSPAVFSNLVWPVAINIIFRNRKVTARPVVRTFLEDGSNAALDPQANYVGEDMCAMPLEAHVLRERYTGDAFRKISWWSYLLMLSVTGTPNSGPKQQKRFGFLSRYLYDTPDHMVDLRTFEVLAHDALKEIVTERPLTGEDLMTVGEKALSRYDSYGCSLNREQIFTFVKHHYDHGV